MIRGRCKAWVEFFRQGPGKDRAGNPNGPWNLLLGVHGEVQDSLYARSGVMADQEQEWTSIKVLVPWDPLLAQTTARDQIHLEDGRILDIRGGPLGIEGKDMLTFICEVHASDAVNQ
jgi:hypothetical protein